MFLPPTSHSFVSHLVEPILKMFLISQGNILEGQEGGCLLCLMVCDPIVPVSFKGSRGFSLEEEPV